MADGVFNASLGRVAEKADGSTALGVLLLQAAEADGALEDHDDLSALLGAAGNTEATFTNYARKTGITGTVTVDDGNDRVDADIPDQGAHLGPQPLVEASIRASTGFLGVHCRASAVPVAYLWGRWSVLEHAAREVGDSSVRRVIVPLACGIHLTREDS